jgi:hypothetical protein
VTCCWRQDFTTVAANQTLFIFFEQNALKVSKEWVHYPHADDGFAEEGYVRQQWIFHPHNFCSDKFLPMSLHAPDLTLYRMLHLGLL